MGGTLARRRSRTARGRGLGWQVEIQEGGIHLGTVSTAVIVGARRRCEATGGSVEEGRLGRARAPGVRT